MLVRLFVFSVFAEIPRSLALCLDGQINIPDSLEEHICFISWGSSPHWWTSSLLRPSWNPRLPLFVPRCFSTSFAVRQNSMWGNRQRSVKTHSCAPRLIAHRWSSCGNCNESPPPPPHMFTYLWPCYSISAIRLTWFSSFLHFLFLGRFLLNLSVCAQRESSLLFAAQQMAVFDKRALLSWETRDH